MGKFRKCSIWGNSESVVWGNSESVVWGNSESVVCVCVCVGGEFRKYSMGKFRKCSMGEILKV